MRRFGRRISVRRHGHQITQHDMTFIIMVFAGLGIFELIRGILALRIGERGRGRLHIVAATACAFVSAVLIYGL
jgi:hypothetical protein